MYTHINKCIYIYNIHYIKHIYENSDKYHYHTETWYHVLWYVTICDVLYYDIMCMCMHTHIHICRYNDIIDSNHNWHIITLDRCTESFCKPLVPNSTVGFHNFNLRNFNLRVSNPSKLIVDVCFFDTMLDFNVPGSRPKNNTIKFRKSTVYVYNVCVLCLRVDTYRYTFVHPVSITRFPLRRFSPGAGLLRNRFCS